MTADPTRGTTGTTQPPKGRLARRNLIALTVIVALVVIAFLLGSFSLTGAENTEDALRDGEITTTR